MAIPKIRRLLRVTINAKLAAEYKEAYEEAFSGRDAESQTLEKFIGGFIEDRLVEETRFARAEVPRNSK
jgi:hypothetical protein